MSTNSPRQASRPAARVPLLIDDDQPNHSATGSQQPAITTLDMMNEELSTSPTNLDFYSSGANLEGQMADPDALKRKQRARSELDDYNQLDEPIMDTLMRDLTGVYHKMKIMALPLSSYDIYKVVMRGWDLWGPLLLCTFLAFNLHQSETTHNPHTGPHFADVFVLVWFGSCVVSLNYKLLSISSLNNQTLTFHQGSSMVVATANAEPGSSAGDRGGGDPTKAASQAPGAISSSQTKPYQTFMSPPSLFQLMCVLGYCLVAPCFGLLLLKLFSFNNLLFERAIIGLLFGFAWPTYCSIRILNRYQHPDKRALAIYPIGLFYFVLSCMIILSH